jgi:cellulose 1,4-beta-cellobiosidase
LAVLAVAKYIGSGVGYGGTYVLRNPSGYPGFAGVMDWDINDDQSTGYAMANTVAPYLHSIAGAVAPPTPTGLTASAGNAQVALSWTPSAGATSYNIFRSTTSGGEGTTAYATTTGTAYTDTAVTNGTTYYYTVNAVNAYGTSAQSGQVSATPAVPPAAPSNLTATAVSGPAVNLAWSNNATNATGIEVWRSTDNVNFNQVANVAATATTYADSSVAKSTTYYYKVDAFNSSTASPYSNTASVTTGRK